MAPFQVAATDFNVPILPRPLLAWAALIRVAAGDASPNLRVIRKRQCAVCACSPWRPRLRPPGRTEAIGQTGNYRQTPHDRLDDRFISRHRAPLL